MEHPEWGEQFEVLNMRFEHPEAVRARVQPWLGRDLEELARHLASAQLAPGSVEAFKRLRRERIVTAIVSIGWSFAVEWFARFFGADHYIGTQLAPDGSVSHFWPQDKGRWLLALARDLGVDRRDTCAVGDSVGDLELLRAAGQAFYVGRVLPEGLQGVHHIPEADLAHVVALMLGEG